MFGKETPLKIRTGRFTGYVSRNVTRSADDCLAELSRQQAAFEENFYAGQEVYSCEKTADPEQDGIRLCFLSREARALSKNHESEFTMWAPIFCAITTNSFLENCSQRTKPIKYIRIHQNLLTKWALSDIIIT